jgi:hypothetical protein
MARVLELGIRHVSREMGARARTTDDSILMVKIEHAKQIFQLIE